VIAETTWRPTDNYQPGPVDDTSVIAETTWRPTDNYQQGPATWDWRLHALGLRLRGQTHLPRRRPGGRPVLIDDLPRREVLRNCLGWLAFNQSDAVPDYSG
jgi:hypothetical protein